jgi:hypothetical protein
MLITIGTLLAAGDSRKEKVMGNYILVPLDPRDQVEETMPRIEEVAQPGMTVIFLISYQANGLFENRRIREELSSKGISNGQKRADAVLV